MKRASLLVIVLVIFSVVGCSNDLSRGKAKEILNDPANRKAITYSLQKNIRIKEEMYNNPYVPVGYYNQDLQKIVYALRDAGFVIIGESINDQPGWSKEFYINVQPTEKLKPTIMETNQKEIIIKAGENMVAEITGIASIPGADSNNIKVVEYIEEVKLNDAGNILANNGVQTVGSNNERQKREVVFHKYDDGWRFSRF